MRPLAGAAFAAGLALAVGGAADAPVKRRPGSWSQRVEVLRAGSDEAARRALQRQFDAAATTTVCVTAAAAAREAPTNRIGRLLPALGGCTFEQRPNAGGRVDIAASCRADDGSPTVLRATGNVTPTAEDLTVSLDLAAPDGAPGGIALHIVTARRGACTSRDIRPAAPRRSAPQ